MATELPTKDESGQFQQEWDLAQSRYRAGINAGYEAADADQMYLAPVRNKWEVLKTIPVDHQAAAAKELDDAHLSFLKGIQAGYKAPDAENLYLKPVEQKWAVAATIPEPAKADPTREFKQGAISMLLQGASPEMAQDMIRENQHNIFSDKKFSADFQRAFEAGQKTRQKQAESKIALETKAAAEKSDPEKLTRELMQIGRTQKANIFEPDSPAGQLLTSRVGQIENQITNAPPLLAPGRVSFQPSQPAPLGTGKQMSVEGYQTPEDVGKAFREKKITRAEAKLILNGKFGIK